MKYFEPDEEEKEIIEAFEKGKMVRVKNFAEEKKKAMLAAKYTLEKIRNINLRVTTKTLFKLKNKALEEGIPYQTLASSVLHKFVNGTI
ncbi:MAG TPA: antitoxin [Alphaproteobacteria bacterium]|jgi:predicted DNA binding CopG/RHH family protein|nr:antitoxin [Alphaproteobacteria bacterium]